MEARASAYHWGREVMALGHKLWLIHPQFVKPYMKRQKNDAADAGAIAEAASRPSVRFVAVKSAKRQGQAMVLKTRDLLTGRRTQTIIAVRGQMAVHGLVAPTGPQYLPRLRTILGAAADQLPAMVVALSKLLLAQINGLFR